jgi:hypothetical protein
MERTRTIIKPYMNGGGRDCHDRISRWMIPVTAFSSSIFWLTNCCTRRAIRVPSDHVSSPKTDEDLKARRLELMRGSSQGMWVIREIQCLLGV